MKSAKFIHIGFMLAALIACSTLSDLALRVVLGYEPVVTWLVILAVVAPIVFYFMWLVDRRKKQKSRPLIVGGFWLSYAICSTAVSYWGIRGYLNSAASTVSAGIHPVVYVLMSCLPIALILMALYIVSETREKRRN